MAKFKRQKKTFSFKIYLLLQFLKNALKHSEYNFNLIINNPLIEYLKNLCRIFFHSHNIHFLLLASPEIEANSLKNERKNLY